MKLGENFDVERALKLQASHFFEHTDLVWVRREGLSPPDYFHICDFSKSGGLWWLVEFIHYWYTVCYIIKPMFGGGTQIIY